MLIFELMVAIVIITILLQVAQKFGSSEAASQSRIADDLAMMVHTLVAAPGDAQAIYPFARLGETFSYKLSVDGVEVRAIKSQISIEQRTVVVPDGIELSGQIDAPKVLCLVKKGQKIEVKSCE